VSETGFKLAVALVAVVLIAGIARVRFFGPTPALPPRPAAPPPAVASAEKLLSTSLASPAVWRNFIEADARTAGIPAPTASQMNKRLVHRSDLVRHELSFEQPKVSSAGLDLTMERGEGDSIVLAMTNTTPSDVAYLVTLAPSIGSSVCGAAAQLATNAMVIGKGGTERRTVCVFRSDLTLLISKVETMELPPLSSWYLQQVNPLAVGLEPRLAKAHRSEGRSNCSPIIPQSVRGGLESGELGWRDLVDFYARHRCETYHFPNNYRAFTRDNERALPAVAPGTQ
jgi:hypothetical protein